MNNETYHFYRCTDPNKAPQPYAIYDYAKGVVGYNNKLVKKVAENLRLTYLGKLSEKELDERKKGGIKPTKWIKTHYNGEGHRY